jgi:TetR/AcrR family transcriptional repressor of nem operon
MRSSQAKKQENRERILEVAGQLFRERGLADVSVADVMQAANMTHGGFYRHFADKDELVQLAAGEVLQSSRAAQANVTRENGADLATVARSYLSVRHRDARATSCIFAALGPELARAPDATRRLMTAGIEREIERLSSLSPGNTDAERRSAGHPVRPPERRARRSLSRGATAGTAPRPCRA